MIRSHNDQERVKMAVDLADVMSIIIMKIMMTRIEVSMALEKGDGSLASQDSNLLLSWIE